MSARARRSGRREKTGWVTLGQSRVRSHAGGAEAPRAAREPETTMLPREEITMVVKRAYLRAFDESSLRWSGARALESAASP